MPLIIRGFGFSTLNSLLLVIPAGAYAGTVQLLMPYLAYRYKGLRSYIVFTAQLGTVVAALLLWLLPRSEKGALLFACYILPSVGGGYAVLMGKIVVFPLGSALLIVFPFQDIRLRILQATQNALLQLQAFISAIASVCFASFGHGEITADSHHRKLRWPAAFQNSRRTSIPQGIHRSSDYRTRGRSSCSCVPFRLHVGQPCPR